MKKFERILRREERKFERKIGNKKPKKSKKLLFNCSLGEFVVLPLPSNECLSVGNNNANPDYKIPIKRELNEFHLNVNGKWIK